MLFSYFYEIHNDSRFALSQKIGNHLFEGQARCIMSDRSIYAMTTLSCIVIECMSHLYSELLYFCHSTSPLKLHTFIPQTVYSIYQDHLFDRWLMVGIIRLRLFTSTIIIILNPLIRGIV